MTTPAQENQVAQEDKPNDKELNFRKMEKYYERQLERQRDEYEKKLQEVAKPKQVHVEEDEDDGDPYVDKKKLERKFSSFERRMEERIDQAAEKKAYNLIQKNNEQDWLKKNTDFNDVLQDADKFAMQNPDLAETILRMPPSFERDKLVYYNMKKAGFGKQADSGIQAKIDANRQNPGYQPSNVGTSPFSHGGDYSPEGQKQAYEHIQKLKSQLRL